MISEKDSIIAKKSYAFALEIISAYKYLALNQEFVLSKQLLRSGTSIGANVHEAISGESTRDFIHKLAISLKEARETAYWLKLLRESDYLTDEHFIPLNNKCQEITKILSSIILTTKKRYEK